MRFQIFGPYDISDEDTSRYAGWLDKDDFDHFWRRVDNGIDKRHGQLSNACGVYLFGVRGVEGKRKVIGQTLPWYVGKAERQAFQKECFNHKNQNEFNRVWSTVYKGKGTPFVYLFARTELDGTLSSPTKGKYPGVSFVEELLIQLSIAVNRGLINKQFTSQAQQTSIHGILNSKGKMPQRVLDFKTLVGIGSSIDIVGSAKDAKKNIRYYYDILGPYDVPVEKKRPRVIDPEDIHEMWDEIRRGSTPELLDACGIYVLAIRYGAAARPKPWYIGTASSVTFKEKCFKKDMDRINPVVEMKGSPIVYFLPLRTATKRLAKASSKDRVRTENMKYVKGTLLRYGAQTNREIFSEDKRDAEMLRDLKVEGLINRSQGGPRREVVGLRKLLGLTAE